MKKFKFFALAALFGMSINAMAQEQSNDTYTYTITGGEATLTGFVNGLSDSKQATVTIPATVKGKDGKNYPVVYVDGTASESTKFYKNDKIKKVVLASNSNLTTICASSFQGASKLATVTLTNGKKLKEIESAAFDGTAITTLDLTPTIITKLEPIFTDVIEETKNKKITTVKLPAKLKSIEPYAFSKCQQLATVDFKKCSAALTIGKYAFNECLFFNELELPACVTRIADDALEGSRIETLTINSNSDAGKPTIGGMGGAKLTSIVVNGAFQGKFGVADDNSAVTVSTSVKSVTFNGAVKAGAIKEGAFVESQVLANVTFNSTLDALAVEAGAFGDGTVWAGNNIPPLYGYIPQRLNVTYAPAKSTGAKKNAFDKEAFYPSTWTDGDPIVATLSTSTWYAGQLSSYTIYGIQVSAAAETKNIEVANNGEGKYYYATFCENGHYKIAAAQNGGKVMVYGAYVDEVKNGDNSWTNQVYMEQLEIIGGYYWIDYNDPVIIKSTTSDDVIATLAEGPNSKRYVDDMWTPSNRLLTTTEDMYGLELKEMVADWYGGNSNFIPYILAPIEEYGCQFSKVSDKRSLPEGQFFIIANNQDKEYPARLNVIWTDGSEEEATAIKTVKKANAENGAQYNLAGQKVNAAYKGIIIKDGKKMIQK